MDFAFGGLKTRRLENSIRQPQINAREDAKSFKQPQFTYEMAMATLTGFEPVLPP
jgi:hypothetical protein